MNVLALAVLAATGWTTPTAEVEVCGVAKRHDRVPEVAANRGLDLAGYVGGVALMGCGDVGRDVWVDAGGGWRGPFLVVDCAAPEHYGRRLAQGDVAELGKREWERQGLPAAPVRACVRFSRPARRWLPTGPRPR